ncbi:hypothetical protein BDD12DRAFT_820739, partial [Trichophaea hybrida]
MSSETHTVMDPPELDIKSATPTKEIGYASIGLALYTRWGNGSQWTWQIRIRRRTTYEIPVYLLQNRQSYSRRMQKAKRAQSEISTSRSRKDKPRIRKGGNVERTVTKADSLVTSKLMALTTNEFKNSVLKFRKPAGDRDFLINRSFNPHRIHRSHRSNNFKKLRSHMLIELGNRITQQPQTITVNISQSYQVDAL